MAASGVQFVSVPTMRTAYMQPNFMQWNTQSSAIAWWLTNGRFANRLRIFYQYI